MSKPSAARIKPRWTGKLRDMLDDKSKSTIMTPGWRFGRGDVEYARQLSHPRCAMRASVFALATFFPLSLSGMAADDPVTTLRIKVEPLQRPPRGTHRRPRLGEHAQMTLFTFATAPPDSNTASLDNTKGTRGRPEFRDQTASRRPV